jgi:hypothetical protein
MIKLKLSDFEWMQLIDGERDELPVCCTDAALLKDVIVSIARQGGKIKSWEQKRLEERMQWFLEGHKITELLQKVCDQANIDIKGTK